ncbi:hypothetical protein ANN_08038 [Periplaneta americana]|uniref:Uncharacterized protein n=1 Tax=Periplaneta americana TaxID=6978 RepID=A0ABQ8T1P0_PERAM|nr:hypothetical protein ANN_08038 [Periplaneta americana]
MGTVDKLTDCIGSSTHEGDIRPIPPFHDCSKVNCSKTGLDPTSDTKKALLMRQPGQEIIGLVMSNTQTAVSPQSFKTGRALFLYAVKLNVEGLLTNSARNKNEANTGGTRERQGEQGEDNEKGRTKRTKERYGKQGEDMENKTEQAKQEEDKEMI